MTAAAVEADPFDVRRVRRAAGLLRAFNDAGVLAAADVHVALRLAELGGEDDQAVVLAAALAVRAPRLGHVHVDLATIRDSATVDADEPVDLSALPWPPLGAWAAAVAASPLVAPGEDDAASGPPDAPAAHAVPGPAATVGGEAARDRPLRLLGTWLYLDRYWREERQVAADLRALGEPAEDVRMEVLADGLGRLYAGETTSRQCLAVASAILRRLSVVAGGPGTGKTTTVAHIVALLAEQAEAAGAPAPLVALAAPTGKAAARLEQAVHVEARELPVAAAIRDRLLALSASTLHRLLGWRPDSRSRFRHSRSQRLPHDVVIVDETSMVSLSMMARLVEAIRPEARLILVGDPGQLASIEAGAVLGDVVGPAADDLLIGPSARTLLAQATGHDVAAHDPPAGATVGDGIVVMNQIHRFGGGIARLAEAIRRADADTVLGVLASAPEGVAWVPAEAADAAALAPVRDRAIAAGRAVAEAAAAGDAREAIEALGSFRVLCAHRQGPQGVASWNARIEGWLEREVVGFAPASGWYVGRPLLVTENDYELQLYNGDTGVLIQAGGGRVAAAFERRGQIVELSPSRLGAVASVHAMTIHKSQGSQFDTAAVLLPPPSARILSRELLYTAATRARELLIVVASEASIRAAVGRPVVRASGLRDRLWR